MSHRRSSDLDSIDSQQPPGLIAQETSFDFGIMDPFTIAEHVFTVHNEGPGVLRFLDHRSDCKCTVGKLPTSVVQPGESAEITVQWRTQENNLRFEHSAIVETNDPNTPSLTLTIRGRVLVHAGADPPEISFASVRPDSAPEASTIVSSQVWDDFSVEDVSVSHDGFQWELEPAPRDVLQSLQARAGYRLTVRLPHDLPQGPFTQAIRFRLVPANPEFKPKEYELPIQGKILRRLAVYGPGIDHLGNLQLGVIPSSQGLERRLFLKVYDSQPELIVDRLQVTPEYLHVNVTPYEKQDPAKGLYVLNIRVPQHAPAGRFQSTEAGAIQLSFQHPRIKELKLRVHFAIAQQIANQL